MIALACWVKCVSRGPVFFRQERIGYRGKPFRIYKLRSMHQGVATSVHEAYCHDLARSGRPMEKMDLLGDERMIRCGSLLRASGLDELPQIFNILRGEMSLVGPRPCLPSEYEDYSEEQRERFNAIPGITGNWQVNGKNHTTFERMVELDIEYARNKSLWRDLVILWRTPSAVITQLKERRKARQASVLHPRQPVGKFLHSKALRR